MGLDTEFGLKSLVVPKRLLRPRAKVIADERYVISNGFALPTR